MVEQNKSVTIKDVARLAGVSTATVSHVLNKTRFVSEDLQIKVNSAVEDLGYYPNILVGSARKGKSHTIGLVLSSISNETFGEFAETIQRILFRYGYDLIICNTAYDEDIEEKALKTLLMKKTDAVIAIPTSRSAERFEEIQRHGVPLVLIDRVIPNLSVDRIRVDNMKGTYDAISYLNGLGHVNIGYIDRKVEHSHSLEQKMGYQKALQENGIDFDPSNVVPASGYDYLAGFQAAQLLLEKNPRITAIYAYYDIIALGAVRYVCDSGKRVPEDISVVGCDNMPFTEAMCPRLTTTSFPVNLIAEKTCDLLMERLEGNKNQEMDPIDFVLIPELLIRDSTAPPMSNA